MVTNTTPQIRNSKKREAESNLVIYAIKLSALANSHQIFYAILCSTCIEKVLFKSISVFCKHDFLLDRIQTHHVWH